MRFRIVSPSCGLSYIPTKTKNTEKKHFKGAYVGPFQGLGGGIAYKVACLAKRWTWISTIKPETQFKEINMLSCSHCSLYP
jgi:hypothetical protein